MADTLQRLVGRYRLDTQRSPSVKDKLAVCTAATVVRLSFTPERTKRSCMSIRHECRQHAQQRKVPPGDADGKPVRPPVRVRGVTTRGGVRAARARPARRG